MDQPDEQKTRALGAQQQGKPYLSGRQARILVAPLDWGLGHATRCIPIIRELLNQGAEVLIAGEGAQEKLLSIEFPGIPMLALPGYRIRYARTARGLLSNIIFQTPRLIRCIKAENDWLKKMVDAYEIDAVISDNRYGLYHDSVPTIFITHQLRIRSPLGKWTENILQKRNYSYINKFSACWVPDTEGENNLAGKLSHPEKKPLTRTHYIGLLSRFGSTAFTMVKGRLLVLLSGPEPQRSMLEDKIVKEIAHYPGTAAVVRGLPGRASLIPSTNMIRFYNHLPAAELEKEILEAEYVIGRCGYSTVMDLVKLKKKSILIPTPGQTEQEYLAEHLHQKGIAFCIKQKDFSLSSALEKVKEFSYDLSKVDTNNKMPEIISLFLNKVLLAKHPK